MRRFITVPESELCELVAASQQIRDEATHCYDSFGFSKNMLEPATEDRYQRAVDAIEFVLSKAANDAA